MKIRIHRGANQIGGCITEIRSDNGTRVLIDLGHNLPGEATADMFDEYLTAMRDFDMDFNYQEHLDKTFDNMKKIFMDLWN